MSRGVDWPGDVDVLQHDPYQLLIVRIRSTGAPSAAERLMLIWPVEQNAAAAHHSVVAAGAPGRRGGHEVGAEHHPGPRRCGVCSAWFGGEVLAMLEQPGGHDETAVDGVADYSVGGRRAGAPLGVVSGLDGHPLLRVSRTGPILAQGQRRSSRPAPPTHRPVRMLCVAILAMGRPLPGALWVRLWSDVGGPWAGTPAIHKTPATGLLVGLLVGAGLGALVGGLWAPSGLLARSAAAEAERDVLRDRVVDLKGARADDAETAALLAPLRDTIGRVERQVGSLERDRVHQSASSASA